MRLLLEIKGFLSVAMLKSNKEARREFAMQFRINKNGVDVSDCEVEKVKQWALSRMEKSAMLCGCDLTEDATIDISFAAGMPLIAVNSSASPTTVILNRI